MDLSCLPFPLPFLPLPEVAQTSFFRPCSFRQRLGVRQPAWASPQRNSTLRIRNRKCTKVLARRCTTRHWVLDAGHLDAVLGACSSSTDTLMLSNRGSPLSEMLALTLASHVVKLWKKSTPAFRVIGPLRLWVEGETHHRCERVAVVSSPRDQLRCCASQCPEPSRHTSSREDATSSLLLLVQRRQHSPA